MSKWIKRSEQMPEVDSEHTSQPVLVYLDDNSYAVATVWILGNRISWNEGDIYLHHGHVTHWMPLPPKPEGEE